MFHLLLHWRISVTSTCVCSCVLWLYGLHPYPHLTPSLGQEAVSVALRFIRSFHFFSPNTNSKQIKRKIKLNWDGLAGSDSRECLAYEEEKDQISLCQHCLRTTIFKSYPTSEVLCEQHCYGVQHVEGREEDYNKQQGKLLTN